MVRNNTNWSVFKKDQDLQEAIAIICESQLKKKIDRNALAPLFPSDRTMRRQLPLIKKKIDGKLFSIFYGTKNGDFWFKSENYLKINGHFLFKSEKYS